MSSRQTSLQPHTRLFLQHVIANQCAHWCGNPFSQQGNLASWQYLWQIRSSCVFAGNSCFSFCPAAGDADCHVAPLLAMTCRRQQRVCGGSSVVPGEFAALFRIRLRHCSLLCPTAGDADCHVASLLAMTCRRRQRVCGGSSVVPGEFAALFRIRLRHCSLLCPTAGDADCPVASLLAMTCRRRSAVRAYKDAPRNDLQ